MPFFVVRQVPSFAAADAPDFRVTFVKADSATQAAAYCRDNFSGVVHEVMTLPENTPVERFVDASSNGHSEEIPVVQTESSWRRVLRWLLSKG